jgi:nitroreductase
VRAVQANEAAQADKAAVRASEAVDADEAAVQASEPVRASEFVSLARRRRTVRSYSDRPVSRETVLQILEAARWAPSGWNLQPWHFVVVQDPGQKERLLQAVAREVERAQARGFNVRVPAYLGQVPVIIAVVADPGMKRKLPPHRTGATAEKIYLSSISAAIQNMHLAAAAQGLGSVWFTVSSDEETQADLRAVLGVPPEFEVPYLIPIGYPHDPLGDPDPSLRRPLESLVHWDTFGSHRCG